MLITANLNSLRVGFEFWKTVNTQWKSVPLNIKLGNLFFVKMRWDYEKDVIIWLAHKLVHISWLGNRSWKKCYCTNLPTQVTVLLSRPSSHQMWHTHPPKRSQSLASTGVWRSTRTPAYDLGIPKASSTVSLLSCFRYKELNLPERYNPEIKGKLWQVFPEILVNIGQRKSLSLWQTLIISQLLKINYWSIRTYRGALGRSFVCLFAHSTHISCCASHVPGTGFKFTALPRRVGLLPQPPGAHVLFRPKPLSYLAKEPGCHTPGPMCRNSTHQPISRAAIKSGETS